MLCDDHSTDAYDMYNHVLNIVSQHGGCSILYSNQYDVISIYFKEERRIVGINICIVH